MFKQMVRQSWNIHNLNILEQLKKKKHRLSITAQSSGLPRVEKINTHPHWCVYTYTWWMLPWEVNHLCVGIFHHRHHVTSSWHPALGAAPLFASTALRTAAASVLSSPSVSPLENCWSTLLRLQWCYTTSSDFYQSLSFKQLRKDATCIS